MRIAALLFAAAVAVPVVAVPVVAVPAYAQKPADHVALGVTAQQALKPEEALQHYQAALTTDSLNYDANWRGAVAAVEIAQKPNSASAVLPAPSSSADSAGEGTDAAPSSTLADSMYALAEAYARRALQVDSKHAPGHFAVALVLGSRSLVSDPLTKLGMAREIWDESSQAIALDAKNDGAYHILGQWYAEIMRLSQFERSYAEGELGEIAQSATWDLALKNLEKAVELAPSLIYHRLDLARAYTGAGRPEDAKAQLAKLETLPVAYVKDPDYKTTAKSLLEQLNGAGKQP